MRSAPSRAPSLRSFWNHRQSTKGAQNSEETEMSAGPQLRRSDKAMTHEQALETLERGFCGRLATVGEDGSPYCIPLLYVWREGRVYLHNAQARGHLRTNIDHEPRVCFEVDEPGEVFAYGRFESNAIPQSRIEVSSCSARHR